MYNSLLPESLYYLLKILDAFKAVIKNIMNNYF